MCHQSTDASLSITVRQSWATLRGYVVALLWVKSIVSAVSVRVTAVIITKVACTIQGNVF